MINIIYGNHGLAIHMQDILEYIRMGLAVNNFDVKYSYSNYETEAINIAVEGSASTDTKDGDLFWDHIVLHRKSHPNSRLYILTTEVLNDSGFNSANSSLANNDKGHLHYDNRPYWIARTITFLQALPYTDGLILNGEYSIAEYAKISKRYFYLPLSAPSDSSIAGRQFGSKNKGHKDIDILFTGTITPYREAILSNLKSYGLSVHKLEPHTPDYIRQDFFGRCRLSVGLKLSENTQLLSKYRAYYHLINEIPHLFEPVGMKTDLDEYINFSNAEQDFAQQCLEYIRSGESRMRDCFQRFRESTQLNHQTIFTDLHQFLIQ